MDRDEFIQKLLATFRVEAADHLRVIAGGLLEMEKNNVPGGRSELIETIYREMHSLKGAARSVNLTELGSLCQVSEGLFSGLKKNDRVLAPEVLDTLHEAVNCMSDLTASHEPVAMDTIVRVMEALERHTRAADSVGHIYANVADETRRHDSIPFAAVPAREGAGAIEQPPPRQPARDRPVSAAQSQVAGVGRDPFLVARHSQHSETMRIPIRRLDDLIIQVEDMLSDKLTASHRSVELVDSLDLFDWWRKKWKRNEPEFRRIRRFIEGKEEDAGDKELMAAIARLLAFCDESKTRMSLLESRLTELGRAAEKDSRAMARRVDDLMAGMKHVLMMPFGTLLEAFPKMVRDLAHDHNKQAVLLVEGSDLEVDKRILEELKTPFLHIVRNSVDHGIETAAERQRSGKSPVGAIRIVVAPLSGNQVHIHVSDDGAGLDIEKIKERAVEAGIFAKEAAATINDADAAALIFRSSLSTSPMVTDLSGRGLGLAIVKEKVEGVGGKVTVRTEKGIGTMLDMILPLSLATFRGARARVGDQVMVIPTAHVQRVMRVPVADIKTATGRRTIICMGQSVELVRLDELLGRATSRSETEDGRHIVAVIVAMGNARMALQVSEILGEQEVLVKNLGKQLLRVRHVAGVGLLGSGEIVPILNVSDLFETCALAAVSPRPEGASTEKKRTVKTILVAEDSITSRTLLKNILQSAGYRVRTAVDGQEALTALKSEPMDLLVSDVQMPRLDGFELTARIRADAKLKGLPVVLVTALGSREHREKGVDAGANAYIVKSNFDQSNLLEIVARFI